MIVKILTLEGSPVHRIYRLLDLSILLIVTGYFSAFFKRYRLLGYHTKVLESPGPSKEIA